jgi:hypothetical protein
MISPNNGKVLLGADGNPLRGASGKIVLADNLYPMVPTQQNLYYIRSLEYPPFDRTCASSNVWNEAWSSSSSVPFGYYRGYYAGSKAVHGVHQITFEGNNIDWPRVKSLNTIVHWDCGVYYPNFVRIRLTCSKDNASMPSGKTIKNDWPTMANHDAFGAAPRNVKINWEINGVEPDSVEIGVMFDLETCPFGFSTTFNLTYSHPNPVRVVYNLAEPTP